MSRMARRDWLIHRTRSETGSWHRNRRANHLSLSANLHNRRLFCERLEDRRLLSVEYPSLDVPVTIEAGPHTSSVIISDIGAISDVNVRLNIDHTYDGDLDVFLIAPDTTRVELFTDVGFDGDNFTDTLLDDEASTPITAGSAPFNGSFQPEGSLSVLDGMSILGTWTLEITDDFPFDVDSGVLNSWSLFIDSGPPPTDDYGDAPTAAQSGFASSYPTTDADNGARHTKLAGFSIGTEIDVETDGQPSATADLDDSTRSPDDEDGVTFNGTLTVGNTGSVDVFVTNTAGLSNPYLDAWIDFNRDGDWSDGGEQVFSGPAVAGSNTLNFTVPGSAAVGNTFSRFRLHDGTSGLAATGQAANGEVEDHLVRIATSGVWAAQGPGPSLDGQVENVAPNDEVVGAIHTVVAHPTNADILYIGGTNGGIWKTTNATAASPTWTPLTDDLSSMSIGALEMDPTDGTHQTLVAGVGRYSSFGRGGGSRTGLLRTIDGGSNWTELDGGGTLVGKNISGVASRGNTIVASVNVADSFTFGNIGIFRSTDGGLTFTRISVGDGSGDSGLPAGASYDLAGDPNNSAILYTSIVFNNTATLNGIYKSTDTGATWSKVSDSQIDRLVSENTSNIEIAVGNNNNVYAAIINNGNPEGFFRSGDGGSSWVQMDTPQTNENAGAFGLNPRGNKGPGPGAPAAEIAGGQGTIHFSILADPTNDNIVYVGGDRQPHANEGSGPVQFPNSLGATDFSGRLFRGDASQSAGNQWQHLTHSDSLGAAGGGTANSSAPHADSREMVFDANGNIVEVDDGGIYLRTSPQDNTGDWFSLNGNLQVTESHDVAYDPISDILISGNQDTGTTEQTSTSSQTWRSVSTADGGDVAVDSITRAGNNQSIRYSSFQNLGAFRRRIVDSNNNVVSTVFPSLTVVRRSPPFDPQFDTPIALNAIDATHIMFGGDNGLYESRNQGDNITQIAANVITPSSTSNPIAYGGRSGGVDNLHVVYAGDENGDIHVRTTSGGVFTATDPDGSSFDLIRDVRLDPDEWQTAFAIDDDQIFSTTTAGASWSDITGDLAAGSVLRSIEYIVGTVDALAVGTNLGVFVSLVTSLGTWVQFGSGLPNVPVWDMDYDATDDVLAVGTLGRGVWTLPNASTELPTPDPSPPQGLVVSTTSDVVDGDFSVGQLSLREAIGIANDLAGANTITFDAGVFTGGANSLIRLRGTELEITETLTIDGSAGTDVVITADASGNDTPMGGTFITDVTASLTADAASLDDNSRVINFTAAGDLTLSGLTITGGHTTGDSFDASGGGVRFGGLGLTGTLTLDQSTVIGNTAAGNVADGGGIYAPWGAVTLTSSTVSGNTTFSRGGGIFTSRGGLTVASSTISGNTSGEDGGGIFSYFSPLTLTSSTVSGNTTFSRGGGIFTSRGGLTVASSTISGNNSSEDGGGIFSYFGPLTLTSSTVSGNTTFSRGGGIFTSRGGLTVTSSTISGNNSSEDGGGIFSYFGPLTLTSSTVSGNTGQEGGGIFVQFGPVTLTSSTISGNTSGEDGGGIFSYFSPLTLTSSTVSGNTTFSRGGGIFTSRGGLTVASSTISGNTSGEDGGGIFSYFSPLTLTSSTVSGNTTFSRGGGIFTSRGGLTVASSTISGNNSSEDGGGIFSYFGPLTLTSSTVSGNTTFSRGGGIFTSRGGLTVTSSTISGNNSSEDGGGVFAFNSGDDPLLAIQNSIVAGNTAAGAGPDLLPDPDSPLDIDFSLIGDTTGSGVTAGTGTGNLLDVDPLLGPLADNGGPTQTHLLLPSSPSIDMGDPSLVSPPVYDQRGFAFARVVGGRIDSGAVESSAVSADFDVDGDVDGFDFLIWQRGSGTSSNAMHSKGDANVDGMVDTSDLAVWQTQYSTTAIGITAHAINDLAAPLKGIASSDDANEQLPDEVLIESPTKVEFIDAVMALSWPQNRTEELDEVFAEWVGFETAFTADPLTSAYKSTKTSNVETSTSRKADIDMSEHEELWLTSELLDRLFE